MTGFNGAYIGLFISSRADWVNTSQHADKLKLGTNERKG